MHGAFGTGPRGPRGPTGSVNPIPGTATGLTPGDPPSPRGSCSGSGSFGGGGIVVVLDDEDLVETLKNSHYDVKHGDR